VIYIIVIHFFLFIFVIFIYLLIYIIVVLGVYCDIYKSSYNIS
jgi:hypothetical protein